MTNIPDERFNRIEKLERAEKCIEGILSSPHAKFECQVFLECLPPGIKIKFIQRDRIRENTLNMEDGKVIRRLNAFQDSIERFIKEESLVDVADIMGKELNDFRLYFLPTELKYIHLKIHVTGYIYQNSTHCHHVYNLKPL